MKLTLQGCPKALGTGECDCATTPWVESLLTKLARGKVVAP